VAVETDFAEEYTQVMVSGSHANHLSEWSNGVAEC
jgi:hypothetical protein